MEFSQEIISYVHYSPNCSTHISTSSNEEDDDDMAASCLILLAQGGGSPIKGVSKISRRKFSEMAAVAATTAAASAACVYECKTCNRTFPSFQALGGHRASHKKPKLMDHHHHEDHHHHQNQDYFEVKKQSPHVTVGATAQNSSPTKAKIHECTICGAEFSSGQALGGHMRRHRPPVITTTAIAKASVSSNDDVATEESSDGGDDDSNDKSNNHRAVFSLDLNLPAPHEDDDVAEEEEEDLNNKFEFSAKQQSLVFSVPALVDCHY